jgi:hypothetical protein
MQLVRDWKSHIANYFPCTFKDGKYEDARQVRCHYFIIFLKGCSVIYTLVKVLNRQDINTVYTTDIFLQFSEISINPVINYVV